MSVRPYRSAQSARSTACFCGNPASGTNGAFCGRTCETIYARDSDFEAWSNSYPRVLISLDSLPKNGVCHNRNCEKDAARNAPHCSMWCCEKDRTLEESECATCGATTRMKGRCRSCRKNGSSTRQRRVAAPSTAPSTATHRAPAADPFSLSRLSLLDRDSSQTDPYQTSRSETVRHRPRCTECGEEDCAIDLSVGCERSYSARSAILSSLEKMERSQYKPRYERGERVQRPDEAIRKLKYWAENSRFESDRSLY